MCGGSSGGKRMQKDRQLERCWQGCWLHFVHATSDRSAVAERVGTNENEVWRALVAPRPLNAQMGYSLMSQV